MTESEAVGVAVAVAKKEKEQFLIVYHFTIKNTQKK